MRCFQASETLNEFHLNPCWRDTEVLSQVIFLKVKTSRISQARVKSQWQTLWTYTMAWPPWTSVFCAYKMGIISNSSQYWYKESVGQSTKEHVIPGHGLLQKRSHKLLWVTGRSSWLQCFGTLLFLGKQSYFTQHIRRQNPIYPFWNNALFDVGWLCVLFWRMVCL